MKKKLNLTFVGELDVTSYGTYLGEKGGFEKIIYSALQEDGDEEKFLGRVTLTIEPLEDAGLNMEVE